MSVGRLRLGELLAAIGALGLGVLLFLSWFGVEPARPPESPEALGWAAYAEIEIRTSGWGSLGWLLVVPLVAAIAAVAWLLIATLRRDAVASGVAADVVTATLATLALLALAVRVALAQPGLGAGLPDGEVAVLTPAYLGLLACALIAAGGWWSLGDERTGAPQSAYAPPPARPAPPSV